VLCVRQICRCARVTYRYQGTQMHFHRIITRCAATLLALAVLTGLQPSAKAIERIVEFSTGTLQNQFAIQGTLNTLAQGLNVVPFGNTSAGVQGTLMAKLTIETGQNSAQIVAVDFMQSSFTQGAVSLSYLVPGTSRQVTFNANGVSFSVNLNDISSLPPLNLAQVLPVSGYQIVQTGGVAEIGITNRPSKQQNLTQQNVLSTYASQEPLQLVTVNNFTLVPLAGEGNNYGVQFSLPMQHQQLLYNGVGLPVSLNYSGALQLAGVVSIPEPSTAAIIVGVFVLCMSRRRPGIAFPG
jgi:hypothetical protein